MHDRNATNHRTCLAMLALCTALATSAFAAAPTATASYAVVSRWTLPGTGGWDCLTADPGRHRLFLSRGDRVEVVDTDSGKLIGTIAGTNGVHAIALAPELKLGYTTNGRSNSITVFDYDTLATVREVAVPGANPDLILYEPAGQHLFVFNGRSRNAVVFDAKTLVVQSTIALPGKPEFAADDAHGQLYVNIESEPGRLVRVNEKTFAVTADWPLPGCDNPSGLAFDTAHHRLFSSCDNAVLAITDSASGKAVGRVAIGKGPDGVAFDPAAGLIFVTAGEGHLDIIREETADRYAAAGSTATQAGARTLSYDPGTRRLYTVTANFAPAAAATAEVPRPRPQPLPDSFTVLVLAPH